MEFWKVVSVVLVCLLTAVSVGFVYSCSQMFGSTVWQGAKPQSKVVTVLKNENVTDLNVRGWNVSIDVLGYRTGFLYVEISQTGNKTGDFATEWMTIRALFEADGIIVPSEFHKEIYGVGAALLKVSLIGGQMWISIFATYSWAVVSTSLYLKD